MRERNKPAAALEMDGVDEGADLVCQGSRCYRAPYAGYIPPPFFDLPKKTIAPGRDFRWKVGASLRERQLGQGKARTQAALSLHRAWAFPDCLGLGDEARWRWQQVPIGLQAGLRVALNLATNTSVPQEGRPLIEAMPAAKVKALVPLLGSLGLHAGVELLPVQALTIKRSFVIGSSSLTLRARFQGREGGGQPWWTLQLRWGATNAVRLASHSDPQLLRLEYRRAVRVSSSCRAELGGHVDVPKPAANKQHAHKGVNMWPCNFRVNFLKIRQLLHLREPRVPPQSVPTYLRASHLIGKSRVISVVPGHWIDAAIEPGAPGEKEFNLEVADKVEGHLRGVGWRVLRPDREAPHLRWEEYLNWVNTQTLKGVPVMEIHGQGSAADYRGHVLGVIGDKDAPLNKELAKQFGVFPMDWRELAVPRRGGVIVESFNADEVMQMAPWHRTLAVGQLASCISTCIERAAAKCQEQDPNTKKVEHLGMFAQWFRDSRIEQIGTKQPKQPLLHASPLVLLRRKFADPRG